MLAREFARIDRQRSSGRALTKALAAAGRRLSRQTYYSNGRRVRLSRSTLTRLYYAWTDVGKTGSAFQLNYCRGVSRRISAEVCAQFIAECCNASSMSSAYRELRTRLQADGWFPTARALRAALPAPQRQLLKQIHSARRQERQLAAMVLAS